MDPPPLPPEFFARPAETVARDLLGTRLISEVGGVRVAGEIVETEAYVGPHDAASHAWEKFGRTARNDVMFGAPGITYVYLIYGVNWCINVVTDTEGFPGAVLVRDRNFRIAGLARAMMRHRCGYIIHGQISTTGDW